MTARAVFGANLILIDFLRKLLPALFGFLVRQIKKSGFFRLEIADHPFARPQRELHAVAFRVPCIWEEPVILCCSKQFGEAINRGFPDIGGIPGILHAFRIHIARTLELAENELPVLLDLVHGSHRQPARIARANRVISHHVRVEVMVCAVIENFRDRMAREEPHARIFEASRFPRRLKQRRDVIAQAEAVAVQQLHRIQNFALRLFVSPARDVIPESGLYEAPVSQEESPHGLGLFTWRRGMRLCVDAAHQARQIGRVDLVFHQNPRRVHLSVQRQGDQ